MTPTEKDAMALAVLDAAAEHYLPAESDGGTTENDMREARAHLASRIAELEGDLASARDLKDRFKDRATRAEAELAAIREAGQPGCPERHSVTFYFASKEDAEAFRAKVVDAARGGATI